MITISLCMIVKDEERVLKRCLDSLCDLVDEIIIVDTGSKDNTKKIARQYTDNIYDYKWEDDFSKARNYSFSKATKDYIYCADADEILDETNRKRLKDLKKSLLPEIDIVQMKYCNQLEHNTVYNFDKEYRPKLYKRIREFRFKEPIHEAVVLEPVVYDSDIEIIHKPLESHASRDLLSFYNHFHKDPTKLSKRLHNMYAKELFISGTDKDFLDAEVIFEQTSKDENRSLDEIKEACIVLSHIFRIKNDIYNFFKYTIKDLVTNSCSEICYELGKFYYDNKDYDEAIVWFYNAKYETESILCINYGHEKPLIGLSEAYKKLGNMEKCKEYLGQI